MIITLAYDKPLDKRNTRVRASLFGKNNSRTPPPFELTIKL